MPLLVATGNPGKRREFRVLLDDLLPEDTEVFDSKNWPDPLPDVIEDGTTFHANAIKKAYETSVAAGCTTLADDSGLVVDALAGAPGVYSARYAGEHATDLDNNRKLIEALAGVPFEERTARYVAVLCLCMADDELGRFLKAGLEAVGDSPDEEGVPFTMGERTLVWFRATCEGHIVDQALGAGGFGYDPHFWIEDWGKTMGQVPLEQKNTRSHRAAAVRKVLEFYGA